MILAVSIINNFGKSRFMKLYQPSHMVSRISKPVPWMRPNVSVLCARVVQAEKQQQLMVKELFSVLGARPDGVCNFIDASKWFTDSPGARIVYRQYATLYFIIAIDGSESELGILDLIQVGSPPEAGRRPAATHQRRLSLVLSRSSLRRSIGTSRMCASLTSSSMSSRSTGWWTRWSWGAWSPRLIFRTSSLPSRTRQSSRDSRVRWAAGLRTKSVHHRRFEV